MCLSLHRYFSFRLPVCENSLLRVCPSAAEPLRYHFWLVFFFVFYVFTSASVQSVKMRRRECDARHFSLVSDLQC